LIYHNHDPLFHLDPTAYTFTGFTFCGADSILNIYKKLKIFIENNINEIIEKILYDKKFNE
jgi:hypothetical protein